MKGEIIKNIIHFKVVDSTNNLAIQLLNEVNLPLPYCISTDFQTSGNGQLNNKWDSENGKNLLLSIVLNPNLEISNSFYINVITSISVIDLLNKLKISSCSIKWPNDVLIRSQKVAGILINNKVRGSFIKNCVIGIGLNVNQTKFNNFNREATSISLEKNMNFDLSILRDDFLDIFTKRLNTSQSINFTDYLNNLFLKDRVLSFKFNNCFTKW